MISCHNIRCYIIHYGSMVHTTTSYTTLKCTTIHRIASHRIASHYHTIPYGHSPPIVPYRTTRLQLPLPPPYQIILSHVISFHAINSNDVTHTGMIQHRDKCILERSTHHFRVSTAVTCYHYCCCYYHYH